MQELHTCPDEIPTTTRQLQFLLEHGKTNEWRMAVFEELKLWADKKNYRTTKGGWTNMLLNFMENAVKWEDNGEYRKGVISHASNGDGTVTANPSSGVGRADSGGAKLQRYKDWLRTNPAVAKHYLSRETPAFRRAVLGATEEEWR